MPLRLMAVYAILTFVVLGMFRNPFIGVPFIAIYHSWRPDLWGSPSFLRPEFIVTVSMLIFTFVRNDRVNAKKINMLFVVFLILSLWMMLNSKNALISESIAYEYSIKYFKSLTIFFIFGCLINSISRVKIFFWSFIGGLLWLSKSIVWQYFVEGRSRVDPLGGAGGGGNVIATELCMTLPFILWVFFSKKGWEKRFAFFLLCIWAINFIAIASRGGFIAALTVILLFYLKFEYKNKIRIYSIVCFIVATFVVSSFFWERMNTIIEYKEDSSAMSGIHLWSAGFKMFARYPLTGVGTQNFKLVAPSYSDSELIPEGGLVAHNSYVELLAENGIFALMLYLLGLGLAFITLRRLRASLLLEQHLEGVSICHCIEIGLIAFLIRGMTGTNYNSDVIFYFLGVVGGLHNCLKSNNGILPETAV